MLKANQQGAAHSKSGATPQKPEHVWPPAPQRVPQRRSSGLSGREFTVREKPPADGQPEAPQRQSDCEVGPAAMGGLAAELYFCPNSLVTSENARDRGRSCGSF